MIWFDAIRRPPTEPGKYLVCCAAKNSEHQFGFFPLVGSAWYDPTGIDGYHWLPDRMSLASERDITHWLPLPEFEEVRR